MNSTYSNKLLIIGNGFDLAHGLATSYQDFLSWYLCQCYSKFNITKSYSDPLIQITNNSSMVKVLGQAEPKTSSEFFNALDANPYTSLKYSSKFFQNLVESLKRNSWVDIECAFFHRLDRLFQNNSSDRVNNIKQLNEQFDFIIENLTEYISQVNDHISNVPMLEPIGGNSDFSSIFQTGPGELMVVNFNYTETLCLYQNCRPEQVIHIHGRAIDVLSNPIIFGYGDESHPTYQSLEDSGENVFLEHIKSFGYFKSNNYSKLISYLDSAVYDTIIVGHSCGLSDRILLREIFEHKNCKKIQIYFHQRENGIDNFKEITQQISRHFRPENKQLMRRRIESRDPRKYIPQNKKMS